MLLAAAVLIAPSFVDWNAHKERITTAVREATGRELTIGGDIDVTILPSPALRVEDVRLSNIPGAGAPDMVRLDEARVSVALGPLFEGRLATVVTLVEPVINIEKLADGGASWELTGDGDKTAAGAPVLSKSEPGASDGPPVDVQLDSFRIVDGTVSYRDAASGVVERIDRLNTDISFETLKGPFRLNGEAVVRGLPISLSATAGLLKDEGALPVSMEMTVRGSASTVRLRGDVFKPTGEASFNGELTVSSEDPTALAESVAGASLPGVLAQAFSLEAGLTYSAQSVGLSAIDLQFGDARATGEIEVTLKGAPQIAVAVRAGNLNLDGFLEGGKSATEAPPTQTVPDGSLKSGNAPPAPPPRVETAQTSDFALPAGLDVTVTAGADVIQYNGALVRDVSFKSVLRNGALAIEDVSAVLPGNSTFKIKGTVTASDGQPKTDFKISGRSDNLREAMLWLGIDVSKVPADRLRRFSVSTDVTGTPQNLTAKNIALQLDASRVSGGMVMVLRDRPAFGLRLVVDRLNIDGYMPASMAPGPTAAPAEPSGATPRESAPDAASLGDRLAFLGAFDANIDARINTLIMSKTPLTNLALDMTVVNGGFELRKGSFDDFAGVRGTAKAKLLRTRDQPDFAMEYAAEITDRPRFARFLGNPPQLRRRNLGRLATSGRMSGTIDDVKFQTRVDILGGRIELDGDVSAPLTDPSFRVGAILKMPELVQIVRMGVDDYAPAAGKLGPAELTFKAEGTPTFVKLEDIAGNAGPVSLRGNADATIAGDRPKVRLSMSSSEILLDLFLPPEGAKRSEAEPVFRIVPAAAPARSASKGSGRWSKDPIDLSALRGLDAEVSLAMSALTKDRYRLKEPKLELSLENGKLTIDSFKAGFSTGTLDASGSVDAARSATAVALDFNAANVEVSDLAHALRDYQMEFGPIRLGAKTEGPVSVNASVTMGGRSQRDIINALDGKIRIAGQLRTRFSDETRGTGAVVGLAGSLLGNKVKELRGMTNAAEGADKLLAAFGGPSTVNGDMTVADGVLTTENLVVVGRGGRVLTSGAVDLPAWTLNTTTDVTLTGVSGSFLTVEAAGNLDDPFVKKIGGAVLQTRPAIQRPAASPANPLGLPIPGLGTPQRPDHSGGESTPKEPKEIRPEDVFKGILQELGR